MPGLHIGDGFAGLILTPEVGLLTVSVEAVLVTPLLQRFETIQVYVPVILAVKVLTVNKLLIIVPLLAH